jgi:hypothetical protein
VESGLLADLGAEVIKVERPGSGDDSRAFGPPWIKDGQGRETTDSAYFTSANRGKKSITLNIADAKGQAIVRELARRCDVLIENCLFDTGDDCIAIKSGRNNDGRRVGIASENLIIRDCTMKDGHGGVTMGSDCSGDIRNVFAQDCTMDSPNLDRVLRFKDNAIRGGVIEKEMTAALIDEIPVLAVLGAASESGLTVRDAGELRVKETDRIATVVENFQRMGIAVEASPDGMRVPGRQRFRAARFDSYGDHRIAMLGAIESLMSAVVADRMSGDKHNRDLLTSTPQLQLEFEPAHVRHRDIQDQTSGGIMHIDGA